MTELWRRVELAILCGSDGSEVVTEHRSDGLIEVVTKCSLEAAKAWVEAHYEGVEWPKPGSPQRWSGGSGGETSSCFGLRRPPTCSASGGPRSTR